MPSINNPRRPIYIDLRNQYDFFTNNDVVRGVVRVHPTERPNAIKITFKGRCKMSITTDNGNTTHKSTLELFSYEQLLFRSSHLGESFEIVNRGIGKSGKVELPFEFTFPTDVKTPPSDLYKERPGFEHQKGHPLPTSLGYNIYKSLKNNENSIQYFLEVLVYKQLARSPDETIMLTLPFRPTASTMTPGVLVERPKYSEFFVRGHHLDPRKEQNPNTLTKLKWSTLSKYQHAVPEARWKVTAHCPYTLVTGTRIPISFSFHHINHSPEIIKIPTVFVRQVRVKLTSILSYRIPYQGATGKRDIIDSSEGDIISRVFIAWSKAMHHGMQLAELGELNLPPTVLPSFKSYGLRLEYRIKVVVEGECAQKTFSVTALRGACKVVCDVQRPGRPTTSAATASVHQSLFAHSTQQAQSHEEQLPAYEPAPSYEEAPPCIDCVLGNDRAAHLHQSHCRR